MDLKLELCFEVHQSKFLNKGLEFRKLPQIERLEAQEMCGEGFVCGSFFIWHESIYINNVSSTNR